VVALAIAAASGKRMDVASNIEVFGAVLVRPDRNAPMQGPSQASHAGTLLRAGFANSAWVTQYSRYDSVGQYYPSTLSLILLDIRFEY
jgi:hypothetical protein